MNEKAKRMLQNLFQAVGNNFVVSFLVPVKMRDVVVDSIFLYGVHTSPVKSRPLARVLFDAERGRLIDYMNARITDFADTEKYPFEEKIDYSLPSARAVKEQADLIRKVDAMYPAVRKLAYRMDLTEDEKNTLAEYYDAFVQVSPAGLIPFYHALSPEFFNWLSHWVSD